MFELKKNEKSMLRVEAVDWSGKTYINIRKHFRGSETDEWKPTRKGITLTKDEVKFVVDSIMNLEV